MFKPWVSQIETISLCQNGHMDSCYLYLFPFSMSLDTNASICSQTPKITHIHMLTLWQFSFWYQKW